MFRKGYKIVTQSTLGGKDQKRATSAISSAYPSLSRSALDDVFPSKEVRRSDARWKSSKAGGPSIP